MERPDEFTTSDPAVEPAVFGGFNAAGGDVGSPVEIMAAA
jgi:hypothetical protein